MRKTLFLLSTLTIAASTQLYASLGATVTFTDTQPTPGTYDYTLTLHNTGTTTIGTLWFSWIPGAGFMSAVPTDINAPTGWTDTTTNGGKSVRWVTTTNLLNPGSSLSGFQFDSTLSPTELEAPFPGPGLGTGDSLATFTTYIGAPLQDPGFIGVATPTPEPALIWPLALAAGFATCRKVLQSRARRREARSNV